MLMFRTYWRSLYFTFVDNAAGGPFGALVDDFKVNLSETDVKTGISTLRTWRKIL